jgi:hypothetical protein
MPADFWTSWDSNSWDVRGNWSQHLPTVYHPQKWWWPMVASLSCALKEPTTTVTTVAAPCRSHQWGRSSAAGTW